MNSTPAVHNAGEPVDGVQRCVDCGKVLSDTRHELKMLAADRFDEHDPRRLKISKHWPIGTLVLCEDGWHGIATPAQAENPCT